MKKYEVIWREIGKQGGVVVCLTDDVDKAYKYIKEMLQMDKEDLLYKDGKLECAFIKAF